MDRERREAELRQMLTTERGREELLATLQRHAGPGGAGDPPPFGGLLLEAILDAEFPPEAMRRAEEEPGDVKLEEPSAMEAPGG